MSPGSGGEIFKPQNMEVKAPFTVILQNASCSLTGGMKTLTVPPSGTLHSRETFFLVDRKKHLLGMSFRPW